MALSSSIYRVDISLSNFNTHYYHDFNLTIAKHPSENEGRMMFRLLAFMYSAHEDLEFSKGISNADEPELWQKDLSGEIIQWIELGLPEVKRVRQALGKAHSVKIFTYHPKKADEWYQKNKKDLLGNTKLEIYNFEVVENGPIEKITAKSMKLSCIIEDNHMYLADEDQRIGISVIGSES
jgi:uncharacterized protein YaeQ